jgi:hypothetical protein
MNQKFEALRHDNCVNVTKPMSSITQCNGRLFIPSRVGNLWLEGYCGRPTVPGGTLCDCCRFANLLGTVDTDVPSWINMWGNKLINMSDQLSEWDMGIIKYASEKARSKSKAGVISTSFKMPADISAEMPPKRKADPRRLPISKEDATIIKSSSATIPVHYIEKNETPRQISEIVYKKVSKVMVGSILCYKDGDTHYECGPEGEIKGIIN